MRPLIGPLLMQSVPAALAGVWDDADKRLPSTINATITLTLARCDTWEKLSNNFMLHL